MNGRIRDSFVSTHRTYKFKTNTAEFTYRQLKPQLFFGYDLVEYRKEKYFKIAVMEKAILGYFYINTVINEENDFTSLRINKDVFFEKFNEKRLNNFLEKFGQK